MRRMVFIAYLLVLNSLSACGTASQTDALLLQSYNAAAAIEAVYAANPHADPALVKQGSALLSAAQAALLTWENAPANNSSEANALSTAIAALVAFQAQLAQPPVL